MTRKEELEARARDYVSLFVMSGAEPAATKNLTWMLQQVEREHDQAQRVVIDGLSKKVKQLTAWSDKMFGTPCEEIRHQQKVEELEEKIKQQAKENKTLREALQTWQSLFRQAVSVANGLTNYVEERPGLREAERTLERLEQQAQQALKEVS